MFVLYADKNRLVVRKRGIVTSGSVNVYPVSFDFSSDWDGMTKTAVFRAGTVSVSVLLDKDAQCNLPWEVLKKPNLTLYIGVCGTKNEEVVLPTIWADCGKIVEGVTVSAAANPPTPDVYEQILARYEQMTELLNGKADGLLVEGPELHLLSGEKSLSTVLLPSSGGEGGGIVYQFGHGLKQEGLKVSVDTVDDFDGDNTLPITAAGVQTTVGNIEALLGTI